jgi:hypothetical protein
MSDRNDDDYDDFESWEVDHALQESKDYRGLLAYRAQRAASRPNDLYAQTTLGEAYLLNQDYESAIVFLAPWHRKYPDLEPFQHLLLDALFALGKDENNFDWVQRPVILRLGPSVLDYCHTYLTPKRKPRTVMDLHSELTLKGYLVFTEEDLLQVLLRDSRFIVSNSEEVCLALVRVTRRADRGKREKRNV